MPPAGPSAGTEYVLKGVSPKASVRSCPRSIQRPNLKGLNCLDKYAPSQTIRVANGLTTVKSLPDVTGPWTLGFRAENYAPFGLSRIELKRRGWPTTPLDDRLVPPRIVLGVLKDLLGFMDQDPTNGLQPQRARDHRLT
jgi:hypothetical protein